MVPLERHTYHRRLEKSITGHRTRGDVISRLPRPAFAAVVISSSLFRSVGVTPFFQWNTCRFQAPPLYLLVAPESVGLLLRTLLLFASFGSSDCNDAHS